MMWAGLSCSKIVSPKSGERGLLCEIPQSPTETCREEDPWRSKRESDPRFYSNLIYLRLNDAEAGDDQAQSHEASAVRERRIV